MTSIFWQNFLCIFNKDDEDFVEMVFNTTFDIQSKHWWLCTLKWLLQPGKLFSQAPGVLIQITMHYQYSSAQQCLHVMTIACNCAEAGSSSIAASFNQGAAIALMARIAVSKALLEVCCYWKEDPATFRLSDNFHIYPQFMFHTQRTQPVLLDSISIKADVVLLLDMFFHILIFHGDMDLFVDVMVYVQQHYTDTLTILHWNRPFLLELL
ncbi:hypothetical protein EDC04DRAFT_2614224 [Pisolithus marmoratus]|nr:hypothetical protein EDC04DRAFT_2614224 [Pisolithus marmoratus]